MPDPINTALSGLNSSRLRTATRANNLANLNTPGYKAQRAESGTGPAGDAVQISAIGRNQSQGALRQTGNPMDLAINGPGFFQVQDAAGNTFYTRAGAFQPDATGNLTTSRGLTLTPGITLPTGAQVSFAPDGTVSAQMGNAPATPVGQIQLANFNNPEGLTLVGDNLAAATPAAGPPTLGAPGAGGLGTLVPGFLESSNVDLTGAIVDQVVEGNVNAANVAVIRTAAQMDRETIDLLA